MEPATLRRLYEEGATVQELSEQTAIPVSTVRRRLASAGTAMRPKGPSTPSARARLSASKRAAIPEDELRRLQAAKMSCREIGQVLGFSDEAIRDRLVELGLPRLPEKARPDRNAFWRGGAIADKHGYILVHHPEHPRAGRGGYVRQHRLIVERRLGRLLLPKEVVDHHDGDTSNNLDKNLRLFASNGEHLRATLTGRPQLSPEERAERTREAVRRAEIRVAAIRQLSESGADPSLWRHFRPGA